MQNTHYTFVQTSMQADNRFFDHLSLVFQALANRVRGLCFKQLFVAVLLLLPLLGIESYADENASRDLDGSHTVNINTANAQTLAQKLDGVGESKGQAIVAYRELHGNFSTAKELAQVKGIGEVIVTKNLDRIVTQ